MDTPSRITPDAPEDTAEASAESLPTRLPFRSTVMRSLIA